MRDKEMNKEEFTLKMVKALQDKLGEGFEIYHQDVTKNNGVVFTGITIKSDESQIAPMIYVEDFYKDYKEGTAFEVTVSNMLNIYDHNKIEGYFDIKEYIDFERVKKRIVYKLINAKANEELLNSCPHIEYFDLAVVFMISIGYGINGFICVKKELAEKWGVDESELMEIARVNTPSLMKYSVNSMVQVLADMGCFDPALDDSFNDAMFIMTNECKTYGAATILYPDIMNDISDKLGDSFYILPSSVHELILIPASKMNTSAVNLANIVRQVNASTVEETEILSDSVYYYDKGRKEVELLWA